MDLPLAALPAWIENYIAAWLAALIVVLGLFVYGLRDVLRFSPSRVWAISSVRFAESIRKRVLWITPLAILGVIAVSQFQRPLDEADAIRQMLRVALFATSMLVTVTAIILACTNLPKEIENRVIYTIVTKPTTRLEIVVGKVLGFARVSATILLIMGVFTAAYAGLRANRLQRDISARLEAGATGVDSILRPTLEYYRTSGLLTPRKMGAAATIDVFAREPALTAANQPDERWVLGGEGDLLVPFLFSDDALVAPGDATNTPGGAGVILEVKLGYDEKHLLADDPTQIPPMLAAPGTQPATREQRPAQFMVGILDARENTLVSSSVINKGEPIQLRDPSGNTPITVTIPRDAMGPIERWSAGGVFVQISPMSGTHEFLIRQDSVRILVPPVAGATAARELSPPERLEDWNFRGRVGRVGFQVRGGDPTKEPTHVAVFQFRNVDVTPSQKNVAPFEFRGDIERSGVEDSDEATTILNVIVRNRSNGQSSPATNIPIEANRPILFEVPAEFLQGGNFDVFVRTTTSGHYLGLTRPSLAVVQAEESFILNLIKSLLIMWLMAILVITVAIFCSTFLSWPIAIVLTLVMLLGRWGVLQLGDALLPGIGNQVATEMGFRDPRVSTAVSRSVEALAQLLNYSAKVLPDISQFASIEDLARGTAVPWIRLRESLFVLGGFGIPVLTLAYVFLRNKEVAP